MNLQELFETRRTYRRFDQTKLIPQAVVDDVKNALRLSSCAVNRQALRYIFVRSQDVISQLFDYTHWAGALPPELGQPKEGEKPTLLVFITLPKALKSANTDIDAGIAMANSTMAAWNHGVGSCILKNLNYNEIKEVLGLGEDVELHSMIGFGYPTHKSTVVPMKNGEFKYYIDDNRDYYVPKLSVDELVKEIL